MWKSQIGTNISPSNADDDDWETDPDFINNVTEQEQRWGSKTIEGSGRTVGAIDMNKLREETTRGYEKSKERQKADAPNAAYGYGGKFGVEKDRMDRSAVGHDYVAKVEKHASQKDYSTGFGGKFGVQTDRVDKSAVNWDHKESVEKHASQKDYSSGFGGKFGVERDRQDKSAVGWDHLEKLQKHDSQSVIKGSNVIEQSQKPSVLKAKFESLAKQDAAEAQPQRIRPPVQKSAQIYNKFNTTCATNQSNKTFQEPKTVTVKEPELKVTVSEPTPIAAPEQFREAVKEVCKSEPVAVPVAVPEYQPEVQPQVQVQPQTQTQYKLEHDPLTQILSTTTYENSNVIQQVEELESGQVIEDEESNYSAIALYDYQAGADDEISFDPEDIITNIEMIDEGWWRGTCHGETGLFPANYVQLQE